MCIRDRDYIEKILSYVELENAGADFMENARVHRTVYINIRIKNHPKRGVDGYGQVTLLNFYFPLKDGGGSQFEKRKICTWKMQAQIAWPI